MSDLLLKYLDELKALLYCQPDLKERILAEVKDHLLEAVEREWGKRGSEREAVERAIRRFGTPEVVAQAYMQSFKEEIRESGSPSLLPGEFKIVTKEEIPIPGSPSLLPGEFKIVTTDEELVRPAEAYSLPPEKGVGKMWSRFTERTRRVIFFSQEEAARLGEHYVGTEHLLLGLVREKDYLGARLLEQMGVNLEDVHHEILRQVHHGEARIGQEMQLTPRSKRVIDLAYEESRTLNHDYIGSEHLLLGLIRETEGIAGRLLHRMGVDLEETRRMILEMNREECAPSETSHRMRPYEVLQLETESGPRTLPTEEIDTLRITTKDGITLEGRWIGVELHPSRELYQKPFIAGRDIGEILLERGWITPEDHKVARDMQQQGRVTDLGQILIDNGMADEKKVAQALAISMNLRFMDLDETRPMSEALASVPQEIARRHTLLPMLKKGKDLLVAIADLPDPAVADEVRQASGCRVTFAIATRSQIRKWLSGGGEEQLQNAEDQAAKARAVKLGDPFIDLTANPPQLDAVERVPGYLAHRMRVIPVRTEGNTLLVAGIDPLDGVMRDQIELAVNDPVQFSLGTPGRITRFLSEYYGSGEGIEPYIGLGQSDPGIEHEWDEVSVRARSMGLKMLDLDSLPPTLEAVNALSGQLARRFQVIPVLKRGEDLLAAVMLPSDEGRLEEIRGAVEAESGCRVRLAAALPGYIRKEIRIHYDLGDEEDRLHLGEDLPPNLSKRIGNNLLQLVLRKGAREIRIDPASGRNRVLFRVADRTHEEMVLPMHIHASLLEFYRGLFGLPTTTGDVYRSDWLRIQYKGKTCKMRLTLEPTHKSERIIIEVQDTM